MYELSARMKKCLLKRSGRAREVEVGLYIFDYLSLEMLASFISNKSLLFITVLRLQLLDTEHNHFLLKSLYGLLMLLPQSDAFTTLRNRLDCVPNGRVLSSDSR